MEEKKQGGFLDDEDELRRLMMEAEADEFWKEEPGDEDDEVPPMNPLFGMFGGFPGVPSSDKEE